jgi:hypothetical protein
MNKKLKSILVTSSLTHISGNHGSDSRKLQSLRYPVSSIKYQVSGIRYRIPGIRYQVPCNSEQA